MKRNYLWSLMVLCASAVGCPQVEAAAAQELTVPNFDADSPACIVKIPDTQAQCTAEGCKAAIAQGIDP